MKWHPTTYIYNCAGIEQCQPLQRTCKIHTYYRLKLYTELSTCLPILYPVVEVPNLFVHFKNTTRTHKSERAISAYPLFRCKETLLQHANRWSHYMRLS